MNRAQLKKLLIVFTTFLVNSCNFTLLPESEVLVQLRALSGASERVFYLPTGDYQLCSDIFLKNLKQVSIIGLGTVNIRKCDNFRGEYLLQVLNSEHVIIKNINFYGSTNNTAHYVWGEQGLLCAGCKYFLIRDSQFYHFGDAAIRVTSSSHHPSGATINAQHITITNNYFENVTQITTTHPWTTRFGGVNDLRITSNLFVNLKGGVKLASRAFVQGAQVSANVFYGNKGTAIESVYYSKVNINHNLFINSAGFILNAYPNKAKNVSTIIDWGELSFTDNLIVGAKKGLLFQSDVKGELINAKAVSNIKIKHNYFYDIDLSAEPINTRYLINFFSMGPKFFSALEVSDNFIGGLPCQNLVKHEVPIQINNISSKGAHCSFE